MRVFDFTIAPLGGFATPLKGDTLFGHFCWQIAYDPALAKRPFDRLLEGYRSKPFIVFSSAYIKFCEGREYVYAFKRPALPQHMLCDTPEDKVEKITLRKELKRKRWMLLKENSCISSFKVQTYQSDEELVRRMVKTVSCEARKEFRKGDGSFVIAYSQAHNTINRKTGTTGEDVFAPFSVKQDIFMPETELSVFVGIDEEMIDVEQVKTGLERIGEFGFGRDASTGRGRFEVNEVDEIDLGALGSRVPPNACYTLSPCVPEKGAFEKMFFSPFTRFGRHGDVLAKSGNPFKNPVIMADEAAVFMPRGEAAFDKPYIGTALTNLSKAEPATVGQGYSLYIPVRVEV